MKRSSKILLASVAVVGISAAAITLVSAQGRWGGYCSQMGPGGGLYGQEVGYGEPGWGFQGPRRHHGGGWFKNGRYDENFEARMDARLDRAKNRLGITSEQEPAWTEFTAHLKQKMETRKERRQAKIDGGIPGVAQRVEFMREKSVQMAEMADAMEKLYAQLTPEQQEIADSLPMGRMGRKAYRTM